MTRPPMVDFRAMDRVLLGLGFERSDITFVPTCAVIGEAMVSAVLAEAMLEKFGGDHIEETRRNWQAYMAGLGPKGE